MSKPLVSYPDVERLVIDWLEEDLGDEGETVTVGVYVIEDWIPGSPTHVQVSVDDAEIVHPVCVKALVRVTVWSDSSTEAKRVANVAQGLLLTNSDAGCVSVVAPVPTRDPDSTAELATFTVTARVRSDVSIIS